ncbi:terpene synthase family protein [Nocardia aurantiaca]|uniref:Terpene synthase n=1 Tax=Nocardia aurantiaca TaxID=2675850 RepID=A0A6I3KT92_9NOCA|nr:terpene cyclase [Nocardia aurantiaca]MTE12571.1 terpene cyclase [Nocardia aurantiaca]
MRTGALGTAFGRFPSQLNPNLDQAREHLLAWVDRFDLIHSHRARAKFSAADFGHFVALVHPHADRRGLELAADWFAWLFLVDDELDDGAIGRTPVAAAALAHGVRGVLRGGGNGDRGDANQALLAALSDLWDRTAAHGSAAWRARFVDHLEQCLHTAAFWEAGNRIAGIVPDKDTYVHRRRHTGAIYVCMDLIETFGGFEVPPARYRDADFSGALDAACDVVCWTNDVYSLEKERSFGEVHNLVFIVGHHEKLSEAEAVSRVCAEIDTRTEQYLAFEKKLLTRSGPDHDPIGCCLEGMRTWMRGNFDWSSRTARYGHAPAFSTSMADPASDRREHDL